MNRLIAALLFCLSACGALHADLEAHLKKAKRCDCHAMKNIDFIYMINLDQRPEKWKRSIEQLAPFGVTPYRFSAVNGWELTLEDLNDVGLVFSPEMAPGILGTRYPLDGNFEPKHETIDQIGETYFCHCMARGTIGIALSHISVLQDAFDAGYQTIWVMEDDIDLRRDPNVLPGLIDRLDALVGKENWDILFTDRDIRDAHGNYVPTYWAGKRPDFLYNTQSNNYAQRNEISPEFRTIGARSGAHSMIVRRSGMEKLLRFFKSRQIFFPYDMEYVLPPGIKLFTVLDDVVSNTPNAASDNGGPNYLNK